jgi:transcriptional regulator with XRE-family HTH domain
MMIVNRIGEIAKAEGYSIQTFAKKAGLNYKTAADLFKAHAARIGLDVLEKDAPTNTASLPSDP